MSSMEASLPSACTALPGGLDEFPTALLAVGLPAGGAAVRRDACRRVSGAVGEARGIGCSRYPAYQVRWVSVTRWIEGDSHAQRIRSSTQNRARNSRGRGGRRQQDSVRPHRRRVHQVVQPGHAHRGPGRADRTLRPAGGAHRRGGRGRRPEALPRLQPDPRSGAGLGTVTGNARLRPAAGLRHRPGNSAGPGQQDQARPDRVRHRRRRGLRLGCAHCR